MVLNPTSTGFLLLASVVVLIASLFLTYDPVDLCAASNGLKFCVGFNNAYAFVMCIMEIIVCVVALFMLKMKQAILQKVLVAKAPLIGPITVESLISLFLFVNITIGAFILTNMPEHGFDQTNNGYFACWAGACASLGNIGVDPAKMVDDLRAKTGVSPAFGLIISSIMVILQSYPYLAFDPTQMPADGGPWRPVPVWHSNPPSPPRAPPPPSKPPSGRMLQQQNIMDYNIQAMIYAFWLSIVTLCFACFIVFKPGYISGKVEKLFTFLYLVLLVCWVIEAFWTTFPGSSPFHVTCNGYFGSWLGVAFSAQLLFFKPPVNPSVQLEEYKENPSEIAMGSMNKDQDGMVSEPL